MRTCGPRPGKAAGSKSSVDPDDLWGCPICCRWDQYLPLGSEDWVVCHRHRTKFMWAAGGGCWSDAEEQDPKSAEVLQHYSEVEPAYPTVPLDLAAALRRLAAAACGGHVRKAGASRKKLAADARLVQNWLAAYETTWVQRVLISDELNPLLKGAVQR